MDLSGRLTELIRPAVEALGFEIVRVLIIGRQRIRVQVMVERLDQSPMTVDDCARISRALSAVLDVEDPIQGAYTLEVSSPGIDRPLVRLSDFARFAGHAARIELNRLIDGRRRYQGRLLGTEGDAVRLDADGGEVRLAFADIAQAKLVLSDALLETRK